MAYTTVDVTLLEVEYHTENDSYSCHMGSDSLYDVYSDSEKENKFSLSISDKADFNFYQILSLRN